MQRVFICELIQFVELPVYSRADDCRDFFSRFFLLPFLTEFCFSDSAIVGQIKRKSEKQ